MNISPANTQSSDWKPDTKPLSQHIGLSGQHTNIEANPIEAQSEYWTPETKPLSQHIGFTKKEKVFESGMTLSDITTKAML